MHELIWKEKVHREGKVDEGRNNDSLAQLTILESLYDFRIARLTLDRPIKWRNEKFIFRELFQAADVMHLAVRLHHGDAAVLRCIVAQVSVANVQALLNI